MQILQKLFQSKISNYYLYISLLKYDIYYTASEIHITYFFPLSTTWMWPYKFYDKFYDPSSWEAREHLQLEK